MRSAKLTVIVMQVNKDGNSCATMKRNYCTSLEGIVAIVNCRINFTGTINSSHIHKIYTKNLDLE